jgi:DNA-binding CsgD family transcriptional regulator
MFEIRIKLTKKSEGKFETGNMSPYANKEFRSSVIIQFTIEPLGHFQSGKFTMFCMVAPIIPELMPNARYGSEFVFNLCIPQIGSYGFAGCYDKRKIIKGQCHPKFMSINNIRPYGQITILEIVEFDTLILLIINLCPAVWLHYYYLKYQAKITGKGESFVFWRNFIEEYGLTDREEQIIELIMDGKSNQEIEDTLYISVHTVKNHIYNIYQKTGVNSRTQLLHLIKQLVSREN